MHRCHRKLWFLLMLALLWGTLAACRQDAANPEVSERATEEPADLATTPLSPAPTNAPAATATAPPTETPLPTPTPEPDPKELVVCMAAEPADLYLYGVNMLAQQAIFHGLYENLYTNLDHAYQAQGLEKLPSLADGDATLEPVQVSEGETVVDAAGDVVVLQSGIRVMDHEGQEVEFGGEPLQMSQLTVEFTFRELVWEDGEPVTAADSVFSYQIAADPDTQRPDLTVERTASYEAAGERTVRWTGLPGYLDNHYFLNVWQPLPRHVLGDFSAAELLNAREALRTPLANGPFRLEEWVPGDHMVLVRNEHYYRAAEGFPRLDQVTVRFLYDSPVAELLAGRCDIGTYDGLDVSNLETLLAAQEEGTLTPHVASGAVFEHLDFGINPVPEYAEGRPDWFEDVRVRRAVTYCVNRPALVETVYQGRGEILNAYVPDDHPLFPADGAIWLHDPAAGNALLDEAGFTDRDGDGVREDPAGEVPFQITLATTAGSELRPLVAELIASDLAACGIAATVELSSGGTFFSEAAAGPLFGRRFDLALFAWLLYTVPACETYLSSEIPGPPLEYPAGWSGINVTGWQNEAYDEACRGALRALPGTPEYEQAHQEALRIFMEQLPSLPLFSRVRVAATRPEVLNFHLDVSEPSELWNLYGLDLQEEEEE